MNFFNQFQKKYLNYYFGLKKEQFPIPGKEKISLPEGEKIQLFTQEKFASCGPSILKTAFYYLLQKYGRKAEQEFLQEKDFYAHSRLAKITVEFIGIPPKLLIKGIDTQLQKYQLPYFSGIKKLLSYKEIKQELKIGTLMIFSHMGNTHHHPHLSDKSITKPIHNLHYFLLLKINEPDNSVKVADPYGKIQKLTIAEFWERISLSKKYLKSKGGIYYAGVKTKIIPIRMAILLRKYPN